MTALVDETYEQLTLLCVDIWHPRYLPCITTLNFINAPKYLHVFIQSRPKHF